ncbi:MAG: SAF domain-containing protein [Acidimicrobiales bacterium]
MATTAAPTHTNGRQASEVARPGIERAAPGRRHRQLPLVVVGVVLVVGCALAFLDVSLRTGGSAEVLVVSQPVAAGQVVSAGDLRAVRLSAPGGVSTVPASEAQAVVGEPAAVALAAGSVLTRSDVGSGTGVGAGSDEVAVALKPGSYPPDLAPGDRVDVVPVASSSGTGGSGVGAGTSTTGSPVPATVLSAEAPSATSGSPAVISLEVGRSDAAQVAWLSAAGEVALVEVGTAGPSR